MPIPRIQPLLIPVLQKVAEKPEQQVREIRNHIKFKFHLTPREVEQSHSGSGINVFVNRVAWALAHLVMGRAIKLKKNGAYQKTRRGGVILKRKPLDLTIRQLHK